jgi:hypothetical protein
VSALGIAMTMIRLGGVWGTFVYLLVRIGRGQDEAAEGKEE